MERDYLLRRLDETFAGIGFDLHASSDMWPLDLPGVRARCTPLQSPLLNLVGLAHLTSEEADARIASVVDTYEQAGRLMGWVVGPTSTPSDLADRLGRHGLYREDSQAMWGMVLEDITRPIAAPPTVRVERSTWAAAAAQVDMMAQSFGFGMTPEAMAAVNRFYTSFGAAGEVYFAYIEGRADPVGWSEVLFHPDGQVMLLGGSATLEEYRHRGIYRAMVAARLRAGAARGCSAALIQAVKTTSAPVCEQLGFRPVCELTVYVYVPTALRSSGSS